MLEISLSIVYSRNTLYGNITSNFEVFALLNTDLSTFKLCFEIRILDWYPNK